MCQVHAADRAFHAAPDGTSIGDGTRAKPWDLRTVFSADERIQPGDTVWLHPGVYPAPEQDGQRTAFVSELTGTPENPIVVRALPGERVTLDGWLEVKGGYTWYWGFEIADSTYTDKTEQGVEGHGTSVTVHGPGTRFINLDVHDGAQGFGFWSPAVDAEIYGCLIHDFGWWADDRGHGHAIYTQNETGTKRIVDNVMFRGFGWNIHAYTQGGKIQGFHMEGNICFSAGTRVQGQVADNILVSGYTPADRITLIENYCYQPDGEPGKGASWRPCVRLDSYRDGINGTCLVQGNVIMGARGLQMGRWHQATVQGNTIWGPEVLGSVRPPDSDAFGNYAWDANTYILTGQDAPFVIAGQDGAMEEGGSSTLETWQQTTGFDANSRFIEELEARPTGTMVYVRPNRYEAGRAHIAVYNWDRLEQVEVNLDTVLEQGDAYQIRNVQDLYGDPVMRGEYEGGPVALPMLMSDIAPDFDAFLVQTMHGRDESEAVR